MNNAELLRLIEKFRKRDMLAFSAIYAEFERLIIFYSCKSGGEDYIQELTIFLIELLYSIKTEKFKKDGSLCLKKYIAVAIRNKYITLCREALKYESHLAQAEEKDFGYYSSAEERILIKDILKKLSPRQRMVIKYKYIYGYSDIELSCLLNISRQAVNRLKNRAITALKEYYM
ncbi:MAG: sigma-70 family RNA polymerase sigma factor [Clostridia bacterium]|nr:sigma-70 family RNA polymerase sigma factor [Clostridia bacterium]